MNQFLSNRQWEKYSVIGDKDLLIAVVDLLMDRHVDFTLLDIQAAFFQAIKLFEGQNHNINLLKEIKLYAEGHHVWTCFEKTGREKETREQIPGEDLFSGQKDKSSH